MHIRSILYNIAEDIINWLILLVILNKIFLLCLHSGMALGSSILLFVPVMVTNCHITKPLASTRAKGGQCFEEPGYGLDN